MKALLSNENNLIILLDNDNNVVPFKEAKEIFNNNKDFIQIKKIVIPQDTKTINLFNTHIEINTINKKFKYNLNMFDKIKESILILKEFFKNVDIKATNFQKRFKINIKAREYQDETSNNILFHKKGLVYAPTGSGKTNIMCYTFAKNPTNTLIIVPTKELVKQTKARFLEVLNINDDFIGMINSDVKNKTKEIKPILVTTWQSIKNDIKQLIKEYNYSTIFVDEAHHSSANVINSTIQDLLTEKTRLYGFSATPYRTQEEDENKIFKLFDNQIVAKITVERLYQEKYLVKPSIQIIKNNKNYSLSNIVKYNFINNIIDKKKKENSKYIDFIDSLFKIPAFVLSDKKMSNFITIEKFNKEAKANHSDLSNAKTFFKDNNVDIEQIRNILLDNVTDFEDNQYIKLLKDCYRIYSDDFLHNNNQNKFYQNFDFSQKIGYIKKSIDEDVFRIDNIFNQITKSILTTNMVNTIILVNTINLFTNYKEKISKFLIDNKMEIDFFCINGNSEKNLKAIKESNNYILLATSDFMREGIDLPNAQRLFCVSPILPPFSPKYALEQIIGRVIRPYKDKDYAEIYVFDAFTSDFSAKRNEIFKIVQDNLKPDDFQIGDVMFNFLKSKETKISKIPINDKNDLNNSNLSNTPYLINYFTKDKDDNYYYYNNLDEKIYTDLSKIKNIEEYKKININNEPFYYLKNGFLSRSQIDDTSMNVANLLYSIKEVNNGENLNINKNIAKNIFDYENINIKNELSFITDNKFLQQAIKNKYIVSVPSKLYSLNLSLILKDNIRYNESTDSYIFIHNKPYDFIKEIKAKYTENDSLYESLNNSEIIKIDKFDSTIDANLFNFIIRDFIQNDSLTLFEIFKKTLRLKEDSNETIIESLKLSKMVMLTYNNDEKSKKNIYNFLSSLFFTLYTKNNEKDISQEKVKLLDDIYSLAPTEYKDNLKSLYEMLKNSFLGISYPDIKDKISVVNLAVLNEVINNLNLSPLEIKDTKFYKIDKNYINTDDNYIVIKNTNNTEFMTEKDYIYNYQKKLGYPIFYKELNKTKEELDELLKSDQFIKIAEIENKELKERYIYVIDSCSKQSFRFTFDETIEKITRTQQYDYNIYSKLISDASIEELTELKQNYKDLFLEGKNKIEELLLTSPYNTNYNEQNIKDFEELMSLFKKYELERFLQNNFTTQYISRHLMTGFSDINSLEKERFIKDLMFQLSSVNNFLGQYNYTTLQHSCNVAKISVDLAKKDGITSESILKEIQLKALLHDAIEIFISDIPTPIKENNPNLYEIEKKLNSIVYNFLDLKINKNDIYINRADKLERQTFIDIYMKNETFVEDTLKSFISKMIDSQLLTDKFQIKDTIKLMINEYDKYLKDELSINSMSSLTQKWIKSYRLTKDSFGLSHNERLKLDLDFNLNKPQLDVVTEFCKLFNESSNIYISSDNLSNELYKYNHPHKNLQDIEDFIKKQVTDINLKIDEGIFVKKDDFYQDIEKSSKINFKL